MQNKWVENLGESKEYAFYLALGYSKRAAAVLSAVTYGDRELSFILAHMDGEDKLAKLYDWLFSIDSVSPEQAIKAYYWQLHQPEKKAKKEAEYFYNNGYPDEVMKNVVAKEQQSNLADFVSGEEECLYLLEDCDCSAAPMSAAASFARLASFAPTDSYEPIEEKPARNVFTSPTSTFRMTTSTASMGMLLNQIRAGRGITMDQVRIEEVLNYFDYDAAPPTDARFRISTELLPKKYGKTLLYINAQACAEAKEHQNIVLLLDVSGSMYDNREVTQESIAAILSKLHPGDRFSLVTYSTKDHTVIDGWRIESEQDKERIMGVILGLEIDGCTYGSAGIETAYELGAKYYHPDWSNQVILVTDGDLNFGITRKGDLKELIEEKKKSNLFLSVIGTGLWNYKDDKLEVLSKHGNGTYCVVNELPDVEESIVRRYISLTNIIAKDVKAQVEFNPRRVKSHRLLGYENRELAHEDFKNDKVISEPYGSGGHGVALYELELADGGTPRAELKYQTAMLTDSDEIAIIKLRYKEPLSDRSEEIEAVVTGVEGVSADAHLAYLLYCISETLRGSDKLDDCDREYLDNMRSGSLYKVFKGVNGEKLDQIMSVLK